MTYTTYKTYKISQFIAKFNFPSPSWEDLPVGFPNISKEGLSYEQGLLLDAIKLAYFNEVSGKAFISRISKAWPASLVVRIGLICLICLISLAGFLRFISSYSQEGSYARTVNAATIKVGEIVESTRSAILNYK